MSKNNMKRKVMAGIAVGMTGVITATPVFAADTKDRVVSKDETVYVNADAGGKEEKITVSDWLKNAGKEKELKDKSELQDIKNVKGNESFKISQDSIVWKTEGKDIYYQGTSKKELPVSVKFTYYLDGKEMSPEKLKGKSGQLKIKIDYENKEKKKVKIDGKEEELYSPFMMVTGMILPDDVFSNVKIDNGKVISDGQRNMVVGVAMPGMKESLGMDGLKEESAISLPESLEITADVKDFAMNSTFTVALPDLLEEIDVNQLTDFDALKDAMDDLEDAALELVAGSKDLADGASVLDEKYKDFDAGIRTLQSGITALQGGAKELSSGIDSYTKGVDTLNNGIQTYLGKDGEMTVKVTEYVNGVNAVIQGVKDYTDGTSLLSDGITDYVKGEEALADGAKELSSLKVGLTQIQHAVSGLYSSIDGEGTSAEDIKAASKALASGTQKLEDALESMGSKMGKIDDMAEAGQNLIDETEGLSEMMKKEILTPVSQMMDVGTKMMGEMQSLYNQLESLDTACQKAMQQAEEKVVNQVNSQIRDRNTKLASVRQQTQDSNAKVQKAIQDLNTQITQAERKGDTQLAQRLTGVVNTLKGAQINAGDIKDLDDIPSLDIQVQIPKPDFGNLQSMMKQMQASFDKVKQTMTGLQPQLQELQGKLDQITDMKDQIPEKPIETLKENVKQLNTGMKGLNTAIGTFSSNLGTLNDATSSLSDATNGIDALLKGFDQLGSANDMLMKGAQQIKNNTPVLMAGVTTLAGGTQELNSGLNELSGQFISGARALANNSQALRKGAGDMNSGVNKLTGGAKELGLASTQIGAGIAALDDGAKQLSQGAEQFNEEGIKKLQETVEDKLGSIVDRMKLLVSEDWDYDTYSGKPDDLDGNVKFIIETESIE